MPDFEVIEGGNDGGARRNAEIAEQYFIDFVREIVRCVSGGGRSFAVLKALSTFAEHCADHEVESSGAIDDAMNQINRQLFGTTVGVNFYGNESNVLGSALKVVAEHLADDKGAKGRLSQRREDLRLFIEEEVFLREELCRENGRSYIDGLKKRANKRQPPQR